MYDIVLHKFDAEIKLFVSEMLCKEVKKRANVDKALKNVWLKNAVVRKTLNNKDVE